MKFDLSFHGLATLIDNIRFLHMFPNISLVEYCSSLWICERVRRSKRHKTMTWLESFFICFVGEFGGTILASIIMGEPVRRLLVDPVILSLVMAWLTVFWTPFDWGLRIYQFPAIHLICSFFHLLKNSYALTFGGVDRALKSDPTLSYTSFSLLLVVGTIAGCGGRVLMSYLDFAPEDCATDPDLKEEGSETETSKLPQDLIRPTFTVKCSFFATILYIALLDPFHMIRGHVFVNEVTCHFLIFLFIAFSSLLKALGWNIFDSVSFLFHGVTQIPREIPVFAQRWSFEEIQEKVKEE